ncbi:MAG: hypothetical protein LC799_28500 [Actinobacteria bacterium]|nr:hypothetical protein [Actinomycetota bacterium]
MAPADPGRGVLTGTVVTRDSWPALYAVVTLVDAAGVQSGHSTVGQDGSP